MHHVLLIRPLEDALPMTIFLESKGIKFSHYPLFKPHFLPLPPLTSPQALIITSKNAIRAVKEYEYLKKIPLYVVGDKTAELAKQAGFVNIESASGTNQELMNLIMKKAKRDKGILWHLSGEKVKGNMIELLNTAGFQAKREIVYSIEDAKDLPSSLCLQLKNQIISHVIFCSSRTTTVFINLLKKTMIEKSTCQMISLCLSEDIGKIALSLNWKKLWISPKPNINELMGYFDEEK